MSKIQIIYSLHYLLDNPKSMSIKCSGLHSIDWRAEVDWEISTQDCKSVRRSRGLAPVTWMTHKHLDLLNTPEICSVLIPMSPLKIHSSNVIEMFILNYAMVLERTEESRASRHARTNNSAMFDRSERN